METFKSLFLSNRQQANPPGSRQGSTFPSFISSICRPKARAAFTAEYAHASLDQGLETVRAGRASGTGCVMYLKSRDDLESFAEAYANHPAQRHAIRLSLNANVADILLVIYRGQGRAKTGKVIDHIHRRNDGHVLLSAALNELLAFSHFDDWDVRVACENTAYLIATALVERI